ncbi:sigma-70 family RNA polymerase sigma factor [Halobacillus litoralis]|uniref:Sigma-70 family RNA polymerase sigma factor n=1 Tax=Halobacillus litoralis TaxID=45668 RepID=A0A845E8S4_9BACI|nr:MULTISPECIES: sigma factor-like helix-turn-helix DNA-binding protein [Halobacillus]MYL22054.1 sigma-70 family RNA polymerase sigma factor [Halobacillus litoralis]MYL31963.1 sigma-70 family RNA polymerase sigma factor [Halobacillus halophilus]MYL39971.1 sigma-70 family RNA polymerase sigma factor [Halobacillus litoralis]
MEKTERSKNIKRLEKHLRNYQTYNAGIKNLHSQLEFVLPNMPKGYEIQKDLISSFNIKGENEYVLIDRIESRRAIEIHENLYEYKLIISAIDKALEVLDDIEHHFICYRYIQGMTIQKTALKLGYSEKYIFNIRNQTFEKLLISLKGILQF